MARADKAGMKSMASGAGLGRGGYQQTETQIFGRQRARREGPRRGDVDRLGTQGKKTAGVNKVGGRIDAVAGSPAGNLSQLAARSSVRSGAVATTLKKSPKRGVRKDMSDLDRQGNPAGKHGERFDKRAVRGRQGVRPGAGDVGRQKGTPAPGSAQSDRRKTKTGWQGTQ
ncbi:MAG TPA: hypothetical protein VGK99_21460 [Acidobacteriota bacterium]|jgi:hypothetical protein